MARDKKSLITSDHPKGRQTTDLFRAAYNAAKLDEGHAQVLNERGGEFQEHMLVGIRRFSSRAPDYSLARTILGKDFISPEEVATARGLVYTDEQIATFGKTLPSQESLEWCRDNGMMLVAGPPTAMSMLQVRAVHTSFFYTKGPDHNDSGWYDSSGQKFARADKVESVWIALRREPVVDSLDKNWSEQEALVTAPMVVPNAVEAAWGLTTYKAVRGIYLLPNLYVRTSSCDSDGTRVRVGDFDDEGLHVNSHWDNYRRVSLLGVAAARKFS